MRTTLTTLHESLHAVAGVVAIVAIPGASASMVTVHISTDPKRPDGEGEAAFIFSEAIRARVAPSTLLASIACGPLGLLGSAEAIGRAIAEGTQSEVMSERDLELADSLDPIGRFVIGVACAQWRSRLCRDSNGLRRLHQALTCFDSRFHSPAVPISAFCPSSLAVEFRNIAKAAIRQHLPARIAATARTEVRLV